MSFLKDIGVCEHDGNGGLKNYMPFGDLFQRWMHYYQITPNLHKVNLAINLLSHMFETKWACFHCLPIPKGRLPTWQYFPGGEPATKTLKLFQKLRLLAAPKEDEPMYKGMKAERILDFMEASKHLRQLRKVNSAAAAFKPIILKVGVPHEFVQDDSGNYETLRKARVHLDAAAMVVFRHFWRTLTLSSLWISIMVDASPQGLGTELYAASFDIMFMGDHTSFQRRLFPQIHIGRNMYTLIGKVHALMHLIFLQIGPYYADLRSFCDHVGTITTDQGTEKSIVDFRDILIPFCQSMNVRIPSWAKPQSHLFPSALPTVGWMFPPFVSPPTRNPANDWPATFVVSQFVVHSLMVTYLNIFQNVHRHHWTY